MNYRGHGASLEVNWAKIVVKMSPKNQMARELEELREELAREKRERRELEASREREERKMRRERLQLIARIESLEKERKEPRGEEVRGRIMERTIKNKSLVM